MKKQTAVVIGYGARGAAYAQYACTHPEELEIVAVAEPSQNRQNTAKEKHGLTDAQVFTSWQDLAALPKMADFAIISTQDNMHFEPALALIEQGYHLLLEKPMAPTPKECKIITETAERKGVKVIVCHVLRFTNFWYAIKDILDRGDIGEIISVIHTENVGHVHQSHSYVRGNWRNSQESSPMILAKSCHDIDLLQWLIGKECKSIQSFGSLTHFTHQNKPAGAPDYCIQGCPYEDSCYYNAKTLYYDDKENLWFRSAAARTVAAPTDEEVWNAISTGPYGRCVYSCDNNVVDHQVVNMEFEDGCTASFTMNAFNQGGRDIRLYGTKGEMIADMEKGKIKIFSFDTRKWEEYSLEQISGSITSGHGGGDTGIMIDLIRYLNGESESKSICEVRRSYLNHLISFAAEEARVNRTVIDLEEFEKQI